MEIPRRLAYLLTPFVIAIPSITTVATVVHAATPPLVRLAGPDRIGTALAVAQQNPGVVQALGGTDVVPSMTAFQAQQAAATP